MLATYIRPTMLLNALFPPQCLCCGVLLHQHGALCNDCWQSLHFITAPMCHSCGHPFEYDLGEEALCGECIRERPVYDSAYSVLVYDDTSKALMHKLKFEDQGHLAPIFADWLHTHMQHLSSPDIVIPVPLSRKRLFARRYNQSALVAKELAKRLNITYDPQLLLRTKHTKPQTGLTRPQRQENVAGAFRVAMPHGEIITNKSILMIDDVMTTGATIEACTKTLKKAGAGQVHVLTLARVVHTQ